jgi:hypothetical protein
MALAVESARFVPAEGSYLTVRLPGEVLRCLVERVVDPNTVIIEIDAMPMAKTHMFRRGDKAGARRTVENGRDVWEAQSDREFLRAAAPAPELAPEPPKPAKKPRAKRVGKGKKGRAG